MTLPLLVLRPEPGASATARRCAERGLAPVKLPLFTARAVDWVMPPVPGDARLFLTSANAVRLAGAKLHALSALPCWCVGSATAEAARAAGLSIACIGNSDASALAARMPPGGLIIWLCGAERSMPDWPAGAVVEAIPVYAMEEVPFARDTLAGPAIALVHSTRAATRLAELAGNGRSAIHVIAISHAVAQAAGPGWRSRAAAATPDDSAMIDMALQLQGNHGPLS